MLGDLAAQGWETEAGVASGKVPAAAAEEALTVLQADYADTIGAPKVLTRLDPNLQLQLTLISGPTDFLVGRGWARESQGSFLALGYRLAKYASIL